MPPAEAARLSKRQRAAVDELIRAMVAAPPTGAVASEFCWGARARTGTARWWRRGRGSR